ncbi:hypothetical protein GDO81_026875 [Engystomops pustulosus]|uniref:Uncharacterized protein n=1 Tax=Engystomops pustulosus TaxID=76066 RepID=A0AAV6YQZ9_ENGPU|nr:hypothetical protein GDO81_026875 [Engystomops pustulosus]
METIKYSAMICRLPPVLQALIHLQSIRPRAGQHRLIPIASPHRAGHYLRLQHIQAPRLLRHMEALQEVLQELLKVDPRTVPGF